MCTICLDDEKPPTITLNCSHTYHKICIRSWLLTCNIYDRPLVCPTCRRNVTILDTQTIFKATVQEHICLILKNIKKDYSEIFQTLLENPHWNHTLSVVSVLSTLYVLTPTPRRSNFFIELMNNKSPFKLRDFPYAVSIFSSSFLAMQSTATVSYITFKTIFPSS